MHEVIYDVPDSVQADVDHFGTRWQRPGHISATALARYLSGFANGQVSRLAVSLWG